MRLDRYVVDWSADDIVRTPAGAFVAADAAAQALGLAAELVGRAGWWEARREMLPQIDELCGRGQLVPAHEVAQMLWAAVATLGRSSHWVDALKLAQLAEQLEAREE